MPEQAVVEQRKIKLPVEDSQPKRDLEALPERLRELIAESVKLQEQVVRLDQMLDFKQPEADEAHHPVGGAFLAAPSRLGAGRRIDALSKTEIGWNTAKPLLDVRPGGVEPRLLMPPVECRKRTLFKYRPLVPGRRLSAL